MASGGARNRSGPAPDPAALRRDRKSDGEWLLLPARGRTEKAPDWPFIEQSERETAVWASLWSKPQAVAWSRFQLEDQVALYVRRWCEAEEPGSPTALSTLVRQLADSLGLTVPGMHSLRWKIAADETAEKRAEKRAPRSSSRDRLKVVPRDGA
jgi:hypothetical protein